MMNLKHSIIYVVFKVPIEIEQEFNKLRNVE